MPEEVSYEIGDREIDGDDYFPVIEPAYWSVSIYDGPERYDDDLKRFSEEQRLVLAYHWYLSEVYNGGHEQFFYNSTGLVWADARKVFAEIGITEVVDIIDEAGSRLGGCPSLDTEERQLQLDLMNPDFQDLDNKLFAFIDAVDIDKMIKAFIRSHRDKFYFSGIVKKL